MVRDQQVPKVLLVKHNIMTNLVSLRRFQPRYTIRKRNFVGKNKVVDELRKLLPETSKGAVGCISFLHLLEADRRLRSTKVVMAVKC